MKLIKLICLIFYLLFQIAWSGTTTITLQNGIDGYNGCVDAGICDAGVIDVTDFSIEMSYCIS
jgi:hypothetical protein